MSCEISNFQEMQNFEVNLSEEAWKRKISLENSPHVVSATS